MPTQSSRGEGALTSRGNIMFDHSSPTLTAQDRVGDAQRLVAELDRVATEDVRPEMPRLFAQLVATLRQVDADNLFALMTDRTGRPRAFMLDALPMLGTAAGMEVMRTMILEGSVTSEQSDRWMTSLALVQEPRLDMVEALEPLVASRDVRTQTILGVSALVHHLCKRDEDCKRHQAVTQLDGSIENLLGNDCSADTPEARVKVLAALKALGNAGLMVKGSAILRACYQNSADVEKAFHVSLNTPIKSLELSGGLHLTGAEKHANVLIRLDDREVVNIKGSLTKDEYAAALRYRPQLAIRGPSGPVFSLSGNLNMNKDKHKYAIHLVISDLFETPVTLSGTVDETDGTYMLATSMNSYMLKGSLIGAFRYVGNEFEFRTNTKYTIFDGPQHTITVNTKMWQQVDGFGSVYNATMTTRVSMSTLHLGLR
ncbi:Apolipophorin [Amphibalanus amphitrite]|uniref:Apolipophorin n=1 Tax=Amphibalanus amphitrite TaxID=1232801 RepID=A0A6A4W912_AMPAM|nr:Apolipophorin [Amphibalanus amphitrite]